MVKTDAGGYCNDDDGGGGGGKGGNGGYGESGESVCASNIGDEARAVTITCTTTTIIITTTTTTIIITTTTNHRNHNSAANVGKIGLDRNGASTGWLVSLEVWLSD